MNTNETIELEDLALTEDQQEEVKGGVQLETCLVAGYQNSGNEGGATPGAANLVSFDTSTPAHTKTTTNHNETVESDDDEQAALTDLEPQVEVKGGNGVDAAGPMRESMETMQKAWK